MVQCMGINKTQLATNQRLCCIKEFFIAKGVIAWLKPKFYPKVNKKSFADVLVTVDQHAITLEIICNYFMKL